MTPTNDQYIGASILSKWYKKSSHQFCEISGTVGTGTWELVQNFIDEFDFDPREVMYLSYDQKQVLDLASKRYHAYYIPGFLYKYTRIVDFNSLYVFNVNADHMEYEWKRTVRKHIDEKYRIIVVFDSTLLDQETLSDVGSFGLPVILLRDPCLIPSPDSFTFTKDSNIVLTELHPDLVKNPVTYFANKSLVTRKFEYGNFDNVTIVPRKQLNLYNLKSSDMVITMGKELSNTINQLYREKIMHIRTNINTIGERLIVMQNMPNHKLVNQDEKHIKIYLDKGLVCYITKCNKHAQVTRYVPIELRTEFYYEPFTDLVLDRNYLNGVNTPSRQIIPEETVKCSYAYALPVVLARSNHWDKLTVIAEPFTDDEYIQRRMLYTAITRCTGSMTLVI